MINPKENPWTVLQSEIKYDNPWIGVEEHQVINPHGGRGIYGVVHFKNIATGVLALDENDCIWLVGQYRFPLERYSWEIPEGGCPVNETPLSAAQRELSEETGLSAAHWELILEMDLSNSVSDETCQVFLATGLKRTEAAPEETEDLQVKKVPFEEAVRMVMDGEITDAVSVAAILKLTLIKLKKH